MGRFGKEQSVEVVKNLSIELRKHKGNAVVVLVSNEFSAQSRGVT